MAQPLNFTVKNIEALPLPATGRADYKDTKVAGLYLRVTPSGVMTFSFVGRAKGSTRTERITFGRYPAVKPEQARDRALTVAGELAQGSSRAQAARIKRGEMTLGDAADLYMAHLRRHKKGLNTLASYESHIKGHFGTRRLSEVTPADVGKWYHALPDAIIAKRNQEAQERRAKEIQRRKEIAARQAVRRHGPDPKPLPDKKPTRTINGHTAANRALDTLRAIYNFISKPGNGGYAGVNPATGHDRYEEVERERFLSSSEIGPFFKALAEDPSTTFRDATLMKLLTGARRSNVQEMRWSEIDLATAEWRIPRTKNGKPQTVVLVPEAVTLLKERKEEATTDFVFPSPLSKTGHIVNTAKAWKRLLERANLKDVREHDLRRTLGSWQARTGASLVLIGKSLNHMDHASTAIYARLDMNPVREAVTRATSAMFEAAGVTQPAEVIPFPGSKEAKAAKPKKAKK